MGLILPYTFVGGTSAKGQEVNANFVAVQKAINDVENKQANLQLNIADLQNNKANLNGSSSQQFEVARAEGVNQAAQAVPYGQLMEYIEPLKGIVNGLTIIKASDIGGSNMGLIVAKGSCWDSNGNYVIKNTGNYTEDFTSQQSELLSGYYYDIYIVSTIEDTDKVSLRLAEQSTGLSTQANEIYRRLAYTQYTGTGFGNINMVV